MVNKLIDRDEDIQQAAQAVKAIAHPLRLKILCILGDQEVSVQDS
jgi:DNA-binding transcriptional ArsR family regulator